MNPARLVLALDTGSPVVSVAVGRSGEVLAERSVAQERSSATLLGQVSEVLEEVEGRPADLGGVVALRGPGSFTGLRIGLATVLGLHQSLGVAATALPTLRALATWASYQALDAGRIAAVVDALRGEWSVQVWKAQPFPEALGEERLLAGSEIASLGADLVVGFGASRLAELPGWPAGLRLREPGPLAPAAIRLAAEPGLAWDVSLLTSPLYARPPAVTVPKPRAVVPAAGESR